MIELATNNLLDALAVLVGPENMSFTRTCTHSSVLSLRTSTRENSQASSGTLAVT